VYCFEGGFSEYEENEKTFGWRFNTKTIEIQKINQVNSADYFLIIRGCPIGHPFFLTIFAFFIGIHHD
jgi:hypothetical protein